ncbi:unnamed protein product [Rotaria magnacalcarata]|uniref:BZIP domain-containing protein n=1 Tax=Rotaria magnacalcarata TaxID=392030 RepID=A0A818ZE41_9BILA|nr:unnamed protein product [Rotaria magnacalcarata]CAF1632217.1 unnamed protein product [Rotaria magnacalcarata]CAF1955090.1 unnamed protein product [Rotaria magnacalcarata]CAF2069032.1 unnamed protein product [Rotaria magnacalcarata]CAF2093901.1 unnamed protein product [Rotaria magnacalcarata]
MADHIKHEHELNYSYIEQNQTINSIRQNISIISQSTSRPNTLQIDGQHISNAMLFTPSDYNSLSLSTPELDSRLRGFTTPELLNALEMQTPINEQSSTGSHIINGMFPQPIDNNNTRSMFPTTNQYDSSTCQIVSNNDMLKQENIPIYHLPRSNSQASSYNPSVSSFAMDNDLSNSQESSSPSSTSHQSKQQKDELQHVPSMRTKARGEEPPDIVRKEKKRERNRQAAQKCRTRKLTRIAELQKRVTELHGKNKDLSSIADCLKSDIENLEKKLCDHHNQGCVLMNGSNLKL